LKPPAGNRVAIITNAVARRNDYRCVEATRLELATLEKETIVKLKKVLPLAANTHNPIDVVGDADAMRYKTLEFVEKDNNVDSILVLLTPQTSTRIERPRKLF